MRVLIVEDDPSLATALTLVMEHAGHRVLLGDSVPVAQTILRAHGADAVMIDAGVPGGGRAFWEQLEASAPYRGRVILLSGDPSRLAGVGEGALVLEKPMGFDRLLAIIEAIGPCPATVGQND